MKKQIEEWTWWKSKRYSIRMQITKIWRGKVNLWDRAMYFRWTGTIKQFKRDFK